MKAHPHVLIVDDDAEISALLAKSLGRRGFTIDVTGSPEEALEKARATAYDAALVDLVMPGRDGADLARVLRETIPGLPVAILTGYGHSPLIEQARRRGVTVLKKPFAIQDVVAFLEAEIP